MCRLRRIAFCCALIPSVASAAAPSAASGGTPAAAATSNAWYYSTDGSSLGPLDDRGLAEAYLGGAITGTTPIWWEGAAAWTPLAQMPRFGELDRWYVRRGEREIGPLGAPALREQIAKLRSEGHSPDALEVRLAWSDWHPLAAAAPLREQSVTMHPPTPAVTPATAPAVRDVEDPDDARAADEQDEDPPTDHLVTVTPRIGLAFPGAVTPREVSKTRVGFGLPIHFDGVIALAQRFEIGTYLHYSLRPITKRGTAPTDGLRTHVVSGGAVAKLKLRTSERSRLRIGLLLGYNGVWQGFENATFEGKITGHGLSIAPSIEWSHDVAKSVAMNVTFAAITQVWGRADLGALGAVVANGSKQKLTFPPLCFLAVGVDFGFGTRKS